MARRRATTLRPLRWLLAALALPACALVAWLLLPVPLPQQPCVFELNSGRTLRGVAQDLSRQGLLRLPLLFSTLGRLDPRSSQLHAGSYLIDSAPTPLQLFQMLFRGLAQQHAVTLIEGHTLAQVRAALARDARLVHDLQQASDADLIAELVPGLAVPAGVTVAEGLFFPDTYFFPGQTSERAVLQRAASQLQGALTRLWAARQPGLPLQTPYQALVLASLVERETARPEERPLIAGVFINRLRLGMRLQTDPSVIYGMGAAYQGKLHHADLLADTPWNTYTRGGLPPTPIGLVGLASLQAALHPAATDALYFVARGNGSHQFSATLAAHARAVDTFLRHPAPDSPP